jgi:hypothetical protein
VGDEVVREGELADGGEAAEGVRGGVAAVLDVLDGGGGEAGVEGQGGAAHAGAGAGLADQGAEGMAVVLWMDLWHGSLPLLDGDPSSAVFLAGLYNTEAKMVKFNDHQ